MPMPEHKRMARPRLADCTKAELIQIIKYLTGGDGQSLQLDRALDYIWYQRTGQRIDRADALAKQADREWARLMGMDG